MVGNGLVVFVLKLVDNRQVSFVLFVVLTICCLLLYELNEDRGDMTPCDSSSSLASYASSSWLLVAFLSSDEWFNGQVIWFMVQIQSSSFGFVRPTERCGHVPSYDEAEKRR